MDQQNGSRNIQNPYISRKKSSETSHRQQGRQVNITSSPQLPQQGSDVHCTFSQAFENVDTSTKSSDRLSGSTSTLQARENLTRRTTKIQLDDLAMLQPHVLYVSTKQKGNGILRFIRNVPFSYANIVPDYLVAPNRCVLFLSFKYHNLHPQYIHRRIAELSSDFDLRVLLCLVDVEDNASILLFLNKLCCINNLTLILAWTEEEAARYLETFKAFEGKDASLIQKKKDVTFSEQVADTLGCIRSVNKTDSVTLLSQFENVKNIMTASLEDIRQCPGIGEKKAKRLFDAFHKPFSSTRNKQQHVETNEELDVESQGGVAELFDDDDVVIDD